MNDNIVPEREVFVNLAVTFFNTLFEPALNAERGDIEIRVFPKGQAPRQYFCETELDAAEQAYELLNEEWDVYFGVNPRTGKGGKKENVHYVSVFHAEVDYGDTGHKKEPVHLTHDDALSAINAFPIQPSVIVHSGGGFHCYWVLSNPLKVESAGLKLIEGINRNLLKALGGDSGTHNIDRVLRVPGTFNFKIPENPRPVTVVANNGTKYSLKDFENYVPTEEPEISKPIKKTKISKDSQQDTSSNEPTTPIDINTLPVSDRIKDLIRNGNDGTYQSRSEADGAVIIALVHKGIGDEQIQQIFNSRDFAIGEKYREHTSPDQYLNHSIQRAKEKSNLTEEEMIDPLFISGALVKSERGYQLRILNLEEYLVRKYRICILDQERAMFRYNGKCYEQLTERHLNKLCQEELKQHRQLFTKSSLSEFIHYAVGETLMDSEKARNDQINYLTMQNGLFNLDEETLLDHDPRIFTTNLLPYNYDPSAQCPRFIEFLNEIFLNDQDKINFVQEAVGYSFHKSLPTPAVFFLLGDGSNGKSVFINTISNLVGKENTSNVSFNRLADEYYILELFQKMINISGETPHTKQIDTDIIKQITAGDWVTGRELYKQPMKFRPFAKHFLAMNKPPVIADASHGMWRRIWLIEFPRKFEEHEMDLQLEEKLSLELSGIFNWALDGYRKLKGKNFALRESGSMKMDKQEYRSTMDSVRSFVKDNLVQTKDPNDRLVFKDTYIQYTQYCQTEGKTDIRDKKDFKKILSDLGFKISSSTRHKNQVCIFNIGRLD